jgi:YegS/Rv2252/BmrU family lipid kinase
MGCSVSIHQTRAPGEAERFITGSDLGDIEAIAVAGGDGTVNEVLNGLQENSPPLAVLPFGTVNVLAKEIGLKASIEAIAETIVFGTSHKIAIGEANGRRFVIMASVGLDAVVVDHVNLTLKRHVGRLAYLCEALKQLAIHLPATYRLSIDGREEEAAGVIIANGRCYAGHYVTSPSACLEKPALDVCRLTSKGRLAPASYFLSLMLGRFAKRADVLISEATEFEILEPEGAPLQADGDILCRLPARIRVVPSAVDLIFPRSP